MNNDPPPVAIEVQDNNVWQIGSSSKFEYSIGWATAPIVTDTVNPYPMNCKSIFQITVVGNFYPRGLGIEFYHQFETDSNIDGGYIEIYDNQENQWRNVAGSNKLILGLDNFYNVNDTIESANEPGFSGNSEQEIHSLIQFPNEHLDTVDVRFVFSSDSIDNSKKGWIIEGIVVQCTYEGVNNSASIPINLFPNPVKDKITVEMINNQPIENCHLMIFDINGVCHLDVSNCCGKDIDISTFPNGLYLIKVIKDNIYYTEKIMKI